MTLDEAIKHAEEVADIKLQDAELSEIEGCYNNAKKCYACAEEHRQLAEWLKELKKLREPIDEIRNSPSTQPEKHTEERTKMHACVCISRQAAIDAIGNVPYHDDGMVWEALSHAQRDVALLPPVTPQPEVIRCKDCKHWTNNIGDSELRDNYCNEEAHGFYYRCSGDDYCSFAERRTNE